MRARLGKMNVGDLFTFLCVPYMADKMDGIIPASGGAICRREEREYGVVITAEKTGLL